MKNQTLKKVATILLILVFIMPLVTTVMLSVGESTDAKQYTGLGLIVLGVYNFPFLLASVIGIFFGSLFQRKLKEKASNISFVASIISSILGILLMLTWGLH